MRRRLSIADRTEDDVLVKSKTGGLNVDVKTYQPLNRLIDFAKNPNNISSPTFCKDLTLAVKLILEDSSSKNIRIKELLKDFGWHPEHGFDKSKVDAKGLLLALQRLEKRNQSLQIASVTSNISSLSFVPEILMDHLQGLVQTPQNGNVEINLSPASEHFIGVCLLVDISGFTKLSGYYCSKGVDGIDDLQRVINSYLGELVAVIYAFGGDVLKFAGDAILCIFIPEKATSLRVKDTVETIDNFDRVNSMDRSELKIASDENYPPRTDPAVESKNTPIQRCCLQAIRCASMLKDIHTQDLCVHVALSFGEICFAVLGGYQDHWECLISGPCLLDISQCLDDAGGKQAVMSPAMYAQFTKLQSDISVPLELLDSGNWLLGNSDIEDNYTWLEKNSTSTNPLQDSASKSIDRESAILVEQFVPNIVSAQLLNDNLQHVGELREVTTMFVNWESYDPVLHKDLLTLQDLFYDAQRILDEFGGFLRQYLVDDKGCVLIALWGVPSASYIDNSYRALNAAVKIHSSFRKQGMKASFGLTTGKVFVGMVGSYIRMEYAAIGDSVNMAARLMSKADGEIFVDLTTYNKLPKISRTYLKHKGKFAVKGKAQPIDIYQYAKEDFDSDLVETDSLDNVVIREVVRIEFLRAFDIICGAKSSKSIRGSGSEGGNSGALQNFISATGLNWLLPSPSSSPSHDVSRNPSQSNFNTDENPESPFKPTCPLQAILIEGDDESMSRSFGAWLKLECAVKANFQIKFALVLLEAEDLRKSFSLWRYVFCEIVGGSVSENASKFNECLIKVLMREYSDAVGVQKLYLPAMLKAFRESDSKASKDDTKEDISDSFVLETVQRFMAQLLGSSRFVLYIEKAHYMSEACEKVLIYLKNISANSLVVLTGMSYSNKPSSSSQPLAAPSIDDKDIREERSRSLSRSLWLGGQEKVSQAYISESIEKCFERSASAGNFGKIVLEDYTSEEIQSILRLNSSFSSVQVEALADIIYSITYGNAYWVEDMVEFANRAGAKILLEGVKEDNLTMTELEDFEYEEALATTDNQILHQAKLESFIICRLEQLSSMDRKILRVASVVGMSFNCHMLYAILPRRLKTQMYKSLTRLVARKWLSHSADFESVYVFNHGLVWGTICRLNPAKERKQIHRLCGHFLEENPASLDYLSSLLELVEHYSYCDQEKAFEFNAKAAAFVVEKMRSEDLEKWFEIMNRAKTFATRRHHFSKLRSLIEQFETARPEISSSPVALREKQGDAVAKLAEIAAGEEAFIGSPQKSNKNNLVQSPFLVGVQNRLSRWISSILRPSPQKKVTPLDGFEDTMSNLKTNDSSMLEDEKRMDAELSSPHLVYYKKLTLLKKQIGWLDQRRTSTVSDNSSNPKTRDSEISFGHPSPLAINTSVDYNSSPTPISSVAPTPTNVTGRNSATFPV